MRCRVRWEEVQLFLAVLVSGGKKNDWSGWGGLGVLELLFVRRLLGCALKLLTDRPCAVGTLTAVIPGQGGLFVKNAAKSGMDKPLIGESLPTSPRAKLNLVLDLIEYWFCMTGPSQMRSLTCSEIWFSTASWHQATRRNGSPSPEA